MTGVVTLGETMGLFIAEEPGRMTHVDRFRFGIGGAESNVAIGLRRLGTPAAWIGRVGADGEGDTVLRELAAELVELHVVVDDEAPTGLMIKTRPVGGLTRVEYRRAGSAGSRLSPADIPDAVVRAASVLHVTGITPALSPSARAAVDHAVTVAKEAGVLVSFDVNHRSALWSTETAAPIYVALAQRADIVFAGVDEARLLVPDVADDDLLGALAALGPSQVILKLGADGCRALIGGILHEIAAVPVTAVDSVGAGDAFVAGYLSELTSGGDASARLAVAVRAGAFACLGYGDWESLPRRADLADFDASDPVAR